MTVPMTIFVSEKIHHIIILLRYNDHNYGKKNIEFII